MAKEYFEQMNYTLANEDAALEMALLPSGATHVAAISGSGSRIIPLLSKKPQRLSVIDLSKMQLELCELRIECLRTLSHEEFLMFWGYRPCAPQTRKELFDRLPLRTGLKQDFQKLFLNHHWESILLEGRWEKTFLFFSKIAKLLLGENRIRKLFEFDNLEDQIAYVKKPFMNWRWKLLLLLLGNSRTFNALLYKGRFPVNNSGKTYLQYYQSAFERLFHQDLARNNFFLQLTLTGTLEHESGWPLETKLEVFQAAKEALDSVRIEFVQHDLVLWLKNHRKIAFVSFSNIASYFKGNQERNFLEDIRDSMEMGGLLVMRHYLHRPEGLDREGYFDRTGEYSHLTSREKMQMYDIEILERRDE